MTRFATVMSVVVASSMDRFGWQRRKATWISGAAVTLMGAWSAFDLGVLDLADSIAINVFLLGGGLGIAIFVGWVMEDPVTVAAAGSARSIWLEAWRLALRYVVPVVLGFILWNSLPQTWQKFSALAGF